MNLYDYKRRIERLEQSASGPGVTLEMVVRSSYDGDYGVWLTSELDAGRLRAPPWFLWLYAAGRPGTLPRQASGASVGVVSGTFPPD